MYMSMYKSMILELPYVLPGVDSKGLYPLNLDPYAYTPIPSMCYPNQPNIMLPQVHAPPCVR